MRNFKKLIAMGTALAMAIIMNVSAFADGDGTQASPYTNAYDNGAVVVSAIKAALPTMAEGAQYTVVVVPVDEEISDSNIHYINQADGADAIWAESTTWGTPAALADGTYVVRVGDEAGNVSETYFRVGSTQPPVQQGPKVTFMNGATTVATVDTVDGKAALPATNPTLEATTGYAASAYAFTKWVTGDGKEFTADTVVEVDTAVYPEYKAQIYKASGNLDLMRGDANLDGKVNVTDRTYVQMYYKNGTGGKAGTPVSTLLDREKYTVGDTNVDKKINVTDRTYVQMYYKNGTGSAGNLYYVVNK